MLNINLVKFDLVKYLIVGFSNTIFTFLVFYLLLEVFHVHHSIALTIAASLGVLLTYVFNFIWTFQPEKKLNFKKNFSRYCIVYIFSFLFNMVLLDLLVKGMALDALLSQFFIMPFVVAINYCGIKFWAMKRITLFPRRI